MLNPTCHPCPEPNRSTAEARLRPRIPNSTPLLAALTLLVGCGSPAPLPTENWRGPEEAMHVLAERARSVNTVSGECVLTLTDPSGETVTLDGALAARGGDHLRLRAWKFNRAVFDLTLNEDGLWVWSAERGPASERSDAIGLTAERLAEAWAVLSGNIFEREPEEVIDRGGPHFAVRYSLEGNLTPSSPNLSPEGRGAGALVARIDRETLTVRRYDLLDPDGQTRQTLTLDRYELVNGIPWPMRITAAGPHGRVTLVLREVELNTELNPAAFQPPRRAGRRP